MENKITTQIIKAAVAEYFGCDVRLLDLNTRERKIVIMRQIAYWLAVKYKLGSLGEIGKAIGKKDHATVIHSIKAINNCLDTGWRYNEVKLNEIINSCEAIAHELSTETIRPERHLTDANFCEFSMY